MSEQLTRPIVGIKNRTAQEVFDIMCDRVRLSSTPSPSLVSGDVVEAVARALVRYNFPGASDADVDDMWDCRVGEARAALSVSDPLVRQLVEAVKEGLLCAEADIEQREFELSEDGCEAPDADRTLQIFKRGRDKMLAALRSAREQGK